MTAKKEARRKRALERFSVKPLSTVPDAGKYLGRKMQEYAALGGDVSHFDGAGYRSKVQA